MRKAKSSISQAKSYQQMGQFWDTHTLTEFWGQTEPADFEVEIQSEVTDTHLRVGFLSRKYAARIKTDPNFSE
jgi:hypothetical protein